MGRSHRSSIGKGKLKEVIEYSRKVLEIPEGFVVAIVPASGTGAMEIAMWSLLGARAVDVLIWESFGQRWALDIKQQLKLNSIRKIEAEYGKLPDLSIVDFNSDVVFTWNGTASGVRVPNGNWIETNRRGLTIVDATSAVFAMELPWEKIDVATWSWQKALGGEAAHGMIALSPRAIERLENYTPDWPIPKIFRLSNKQKLITGIFEGSTINTPSMICVEDAIDSLNWVEEIGGLNVLIKNSTNSFNLINEWIIKNSWVDFLADSLETKYLSNTSITFKIVADWYVNKDESDQRLIIKNICNLLSDNNIAYDINGYNKAPPSFRIWAGGTVLTKDVENLLPWIDWAYEQMRAKYA